MELADKFNAQDPDGNRLSYKEGKLLLQTAQDSFRMIGTVELDEKERTVYKKDEDEKNIFRRTNAWSVNRMVLERVDAIVYTTSTKRYTISRDRAFTYGTLLKYLNEEKYYIPLEHWKVSWSDPMEERRANLFGESWYPLVREELRKDYFSNLGKFVAFARSKTTVYPEPENVFRVFEETPYENVRVVIVGQDPYPKGQGDGLAFSCSNTLNQVPYSLRNIWRELEEDLDEVRVEQKNQLTPWARQGIFLLNRILTVEEGKPKSHADKGWEIFTNFIISLLNKSPNPLVFVLWGSEAQQVEGLIDGSYHKILKGAHPAAEAYQENAGFFGGKYFSKINWHLKHYYNETINW